MGSTDGSTPNSHRCSAPWLSTGFFVASAKASWYLKGCRLTSGIGLVALMILLVPRASRLTTAFGPRLPSELIEACAGFTIIWFDP